jgi:hypothetical protein
MFADEADQDAVDKQYLIYGAIYVPTGNALILCKEISRLRLKYGFPTDAPLKFSTGTIPDTVTREDHALLKSEVLSAAANAGVRVQTH